MRKQVSGQGIATGYPDGTFRPSDPVLREQMAVFLYRLAGSPFVPTPPGGSPFTDVSTSHAFYNAIVWMKNTGISTGYNNGNGTWSFQPSQPVLREQMAAFLHRFRGVETGTTVPFPSGPQPFTDVPTSHVFYNHISWLKSTGITTGYSNGNGTFRFEPAQSVLREQMAAFLFRYRQQFP